MNSHRDIESSATGSLRAVSVTVRIAEDGDWPRLGSFFSRIYRESHPLRVRRFWEWQYGNERFGRSIIAEAAEEVVGHVGAILGGDHAWISNVYLDSAFRGRGLLRDMYSLARGFAPLAATSVNRAGLGMYRNMGWTRYFDLQRFVSINPSDRGAGTDELLAPITPSSLWPRASGDHYWEQPGIVGFSLPDGSTVVDQRDRGGLRVVDLIDAATVTNHAWAAGYKWVDFLTSWNSRACEQLEREGWQAEDDAPIPWLLNPVDIESRGHIAVLSELPLPAALVISRKYSDHGRVGSLSA